MHSAHWVLIGKPQNLKKCNFFSWIPSKLIRDAFSDNNNSKLCQNRSKMDEKSTSFFQMGDFKLALKTVRM